MKRGFIKISLCFLVFVVACRNETSIDINWTKEEIEELTLEKKESSNVELLKRDSYDFYREFLSRGDFSFFKSFPVLFLKKSNIKLTHFKIEYYDRPNWNCTFIKVLNSERKAGYYQVNEEDFREIEKFEQIFTQIFLDFPKLEKDLDHFLDYVFLLIKENEVYEKDITRVIPYLCNFFPEHFEKFPHKKSFNNFIKSHRILKKYINKCGLAFIFYTESNLIKVKTFYLRDENTPVFY